MAGNINVNRNVTDAFYRYKMPRLIAKVEGKGNGIKTVIVNMSEIAKALSRPPTYPTKFFGCELGAQTQFDQKNDRYIVNGSHDSGKLQGLLDGFIKKFVLCPECENPETILTVQAKKQMILQRCAACGYQGNIDMRHKLTTFILKNPPEADALAVVVDAPIATTPVEKKKDKKKEGKTSEKKGKGGKDSDNGNGDANAADNQENNHDGPKSPPVYNADDEDDWCEDTSDAAVQARLEAISGAAKTMTVCDDLEKSPQERIDMFYSFVKQRKVSSGVTGPDKEKEILLEAERLEIKEKAPMVLAELLFDINMAQQIKQYRSLFRRFTEENEKAQRYLLGGFEQLVGKVHPDVLLPKVSKILSEFYQHDILSEEVILDWAKKPSKKYVSKEVAKDIHSQAEKFIEWLKNAEEESSEEDDEDDDNVEVVYTNNTADKPTVTTAKAAAAPAQGQDEEPDEDDEDEKDDDDLNIDEI